MKASAGRIRIYSGDSTIVNVNVMYIFIVLVSPWVQQSVQFTKPVLEHDLLQ